MNRRKLEKLRNEIAELRGRQKAVYARELVSIAQRLGRRKVKRGSEPNYDRDAPGWNPLSIPGHKKTLKYLTAGNILATLEADCDRWETELGADGGADRNEQMEDLDS